jgi:hypothetical protein
MRHKEENIENFKEKFFLQKKRIVTGIIIFLFFIILTLGVYIYNLKKESDARELAYEAYKYYLGLKRDSLSRQQSFLKSADLFIKAYDKKKNIVYLLNAGYAYENGGEIAKAIECLSKVSKAGDENLSNLAKFKIAMIYLKNKDKEQSVKFLKEITSGNSLVMKDMALFELGKITEQENKEEALKYYDEILKRFPNSPLSDSVKKAVEELKGK